MGNSPATTALDLVPRNSLGLLLTMMLTLMTRNDHITVGNITTIVLLNGLDHSKE